MHTYVCESLTARNVLNKGKLLNDFSSVPQKAWVYF